MPRTLAIGDIHGCFTALISLVRAVALEDDDMLITLGDYVDRGPHSRDTLNWLVERSKRGNHIALRGNHDATMIEARSSWTTFENWMTWGGDATLQSYGWDGVSNEWTSLVPDAHWEFLEHTTRLYCETARHFYVHGNAYHDMPLAEQPEHMVLWEKFDHRPPHENGKMMVCGHTAQKSGVPLYIGHAICIDTKVYDDAGWLTCFDVDTGVFWQANEAGDTRAGHVDEIA